MRRKPPSTKSKPISKAMRVWQPLIDAAQRSPSDTKQSIGAMRCIGLLDDFQTEFIIAALGLESA